MLCVTEMRAFSGPIHAFSRQACNQLLRFHLPSTKNRSNVDYAPCVRSIRPTHGSRIIAQCLNFLRSHFQRPGLGLPCSYTGLRMESRIEIQLRQLTEKLCVRRSPLTCVCGMSLVSRLCTRSSKIRRKADWNVAVDDLKSASLSHQQNAFPLLPDPAAKNE